MCDNDKSKSETSIHPILERILLFLRVAVRVRNVAFTLLKKNKNKSLRDRSRFLFYKKKIFRSSKI